MIHYFVDADLKKDRISKDIYGHFSEHLGRCIYQGLYVGEDSPVPNVNGMRSDVVAALRQIRIPVLRWPGGCFADEYHWKDGVGPKAGRKCMVNSNWGGVVEDNSFGTHEFFELCRQLGCDAYVNANVGSGTVQEMQEWVEYITAKDGTPMSEWRRRNGHAQPWKLRYLGVGNENWGCGGNMTADYYANEYRRYQTFVRQYGEEKTCKIACGANADDLDWTDTLMKNAGSLMDGLSLHYYTIPSGDWSKKGSSTEFSEDEYYATLRRTLHMEELVTRHSAIMDRYDPECRVGLMVDEWGGWYDVEPGTHPGFLYQQNTMRDAILAGINLNIFNKHAKRVKMANLAQVANVLQSVVLTEGEKMVLTPTYHVFGLYKVHQGAELLESYFAEESECGGDIPALHESASMDAEGRVNMTLCNLSADDPAEIAVELKGKKPQKVDAVILTGAIHDYNRFEDPEHVTPHPFRVQGEDGRLAFNLPACSVLRITAE